MATSEAVRLVRHQMDRLIAAHQAVLGRAPGDAWESPSCVEEAYPLDWEAQHNGEEWTSLRRLNTCEPGVGEAWDSVKTPRGYVREEDEPVGMEIIMAERESVSTDEKEWE